MRLLITAIPFGITVLTACSTVPAGRAVPGYVDIADVIQAEPLYQQVQIARPVNECWVERVAYANPGYNARLGTVTGGILGGVIGDRVASGQGRIPLTIAGTLVGASIGRQLGRPSYGPGGMTDVRRCATVNRYEHQQQLVGYRVDYRYEGQTFTTRTYRHPGRFIRVRVNVDPVDGT